MATKRKATKSKPQTSQVLSRLQQNMKKLQRDADSLMRQTRRQATQLIGRDQKRALDRLFSQAQRIRSDLEKRAQRASKDVESRAERFLSTLEKEAAKRMGPLMRRLDLPSRQEIQSLSRRIAQLERRVREGFKPTPRTEPAPERQVASPPPSPPSSANE